MKILVINSGSSSIKFRLFESSTGETLAGGLLERIGLAEGRMEYRRGTDGKITTERPIPNHQAGISMVLASLTDPVSGALGSLSEIQAVGHRIVHGGERFTQPVEITNEVISEIEQNSFMAPLHNPANLLGIRAAMEMLEGVRNVAVFDTSFHQTMPPVAYVYPLTWDLYKEKGFRRYGFHGTSHQYVAERTAAMLGRPLSELNTIVCHLGNGSSITAVKQGRSIDTSLGYGTVCGVMMGTRSGDVDPAILIELMENHGMSASEVKDLVYKKSGLLGISGVSSDMRDVERAAESGNERAVLALDLFADKVRKYIGAYAVTLGSVDAIAFTAGVGENGIEMREMICRGLGVLGAELDPEANNCRGQEKIVSSPDSRVKLLVVPTNEELMIAMETERILGRRN
ncbi:MAG TPA: acetate kinase [Candidatus Fermentibacter daniensis]|nr:MAG: acetate kinase [Candidatus Fermentibacter daniensis]MBP7719886.1 acetate kinase [Candidatus Fermentibacter sp.]KZD17422.1 MAG: acetate kinase [Candidatus Fermentibacter daniensis]KZD17894.1 MAG: acetate kinase [Candidatus Fermentibacter daniensis]HOA05409.1 acetate kinase [Candidatus Fermentibacter daniensis]